MKWGYKMSECIDDLICECCKTEMNFDFSDNVWCPNQDCLLYNKCYSYNYYKGRSDDIKLNMHPQKKERMRQGWVNEFG